MLEPDSLNIADLTIKRPARAGPGGDQSGDPTTIVDSVAAYYEASHTQTRSVNGSIVSLTGFVMVDPPVDDDGEYITVSPGDMLTFTFHGLTIKNREIVSVDPWYNDGLIDHLELGF